MTLKYVVVSVLVCLWVTSPTLAAEAQNQPARQSIDSPAEISTEQPAEIPSRAPKDFNRKFFYKNKVEASFETGFLPFNTPLILDSLVGSAFKRNPTVPNYELVPISSMIRWQLYNPQGPWLLRGNTEFDFGAEYCAITRGPESLYTGPLIGLRYNFIQPDLRVVPFLELRGGLGYTDAQGPKEVAQGQPDVGQGQDFTFTFDMGSGLRYDFNERYSASVEILFKHISNMYLSEPKYYNHGINVVGGLVGFNVALNGLLPFLPR